MTSGHQAAGAAAERFNTPVAAAVLVAALAIALFSGPIADIDFWWHINSGRWIRENLSLPVADPLEVYPHINYWGRTILQGQWGGQLGLFLAFENFGAAGVVALRVIVLGGALAFVAWRLSRSGAHPLAGGIALVATAIVFAGFAADRPQLFSILCFAALVALLDLAGRQRRWQWAIPVLIALWTNLHQGVLLGAVVAALQLSLAGWQDYRAGNRRAAAQSIGVAACSLLALFATPNGVNGIEYLVWLEFQPAKQRISEYASPFSYLSMAPNAPHLLVFFIFAPLLLIALAGQARRHADQCLLPALLLVLAALGYRYIPFAMIAGMPFLAAHGFPFARQAVRRRILAGVMAVLVGGALLKTVSLRSPLFVAGGVSAATMPVALTEQAKRLGAAGNVFTTVAWGGYLSWQLWGNARPFIDGRYLMNPERLEDYTHILWATPRGQRLFDESGFSWVVMPHRSAVATNAAPYALAAYLRARPDWVLRVETAQGMVFSRR